MSMNKAEGKVLQYLYEARAGELALIQTLTAHIAMTPSGPYRKILERHQRETRGHAAQIQSRLRAIEERLTLVELAMNAARLGVGVLQGVVGQAVATAKTPLDLLRGGLRGEEKLLKNAKDECASEALEIATYDAIEHLATLAGDHETARIAASIRADEERFLGQLRAEIPALTDGVVAAELGEGTYRADRTAAAQAVRRAGRTAERRLRRSGEALEEAGREAAGATRASGQEAVAAAAAVGSEAKRGGQRTARRLTRGAARAAGHAREAASATRSSRSGASRRSTAGRAAATDRREPWPGYDEQRVGEIAGRLERDDARTAEQVREYESRHKDRTGVIQAADREARKAEEQATEQQPEQGPQA